MKKLFTLIALLSVSLMGWAQYSDVIILTSMDTYSQNFDGIGRETDDEYPENDAKTGILRDTPLPNGWKIERNMDNPREVNAFSDASTMLMYIGGKSLANNAYNGTWNFGDTHDNDRAIGGLTTGSVGSDKAGTRGINVMVHLHNNTGEDINSITLSYDIEKYRKGSNNAGFVVQLYTSTDGSTWTSASGEFRKGYIKDDETNGSTTLPIQTKHVSGSYDVSFPSDGDLYLAWNISVKSGTDCSAAQGLAIDNVSITPSVSAAAPATPVASGELFATYQKHGDRFYATGGNEATLSETTHDYDVNYYIVSCGDSILLRATTTESNNLENSWPTQLRIWTTTKNNDNEIQVDAGSNKNRYTATCKRIKPSVDDLKMHFFLNWNSNIVTRTFNYNRASINNPIEDNVAPVINPSDVTMAEVDGKLVFTFGDVTADDEYFYYVGDNDHNLGGISLGNKVYITKPTLEDGTKYKFRCYVVDYNGNKSDYKEFTLEMPFDEDLDLARGKSCDASATQGANSANRAVNGNADNFWTSFGETEPEGGYWWRVDLGNAYDITRIKIHFNDCWGTYSIYSSLDNSTWTAVRENEPSASGETKTYSSLTFSGRYLKVVSSVSQIGIKEFEVYASGVSAVDETNPTVAITEISKTVNSVTLQILASDEDDSGNPGTITAINISGDNEFVTQNNVSLNGDHQITLSGLTYNKTYHFTVQVVDLAGNDATDEIEVVLPFNTELNLCLGRGDYCTASAVQNNDANVNEKKAVDGNASTFWTCYGQGETPAWWQVDLGATYDVNRVVITFNDIAAAYNIYCSTDNSNWVTVIEGGTASNGNTRTHSDLVLTARYFKVTNSNLAFGIKEFEVYGTAFSVPDATNPTVEVTCPAKTINSATLQINASDLVDGGAAGSIAAINISGDNGFVAQNNVSLDGSNQITLEGLTYNTTYTFTVTVFDRARNQASANITVQLPLNTNLNLAEGKPAVAGKTQTGRDAIYGCDGNETTFWSSYTGLDADKEYWYVDLGDLYTIRQVSIKWYNDNATRFLIQGATTLPDEDVRENDDAWTTYLDYTYAEDPLQVKQDHAVVGKMRYLRLKSLQNADYNGINFYELEVYGSDYATEDNVAPIITTKSCTTNTETSTTTLTLVASDDVDGAIKDFYISCADPALAEAKYTTDGDDQIAISGLENDKDYTFTVRCRDLSGNWTSTTVVAHFAMALGTNVAQGKTATVGRDEGGHIAAHAVDGNGTTYWGCYPNTPGVTTTWLKVDLNNAYKLDNIAIKWEHYPDNEAGGIIIEGSLNDEDYSTIISYSGERFNKGDRQVLEITGAKADIPYRYIRVKAANQDYYMSIYEFEVYASAELVLLSFDDNATSANSTLIAGHDGDLAIVTLNRSILADNSWYTLCLPFDMSAEKVTEVFGNSTIAQLESSEDRGSLIHLNFDYVNAIEAGHAYLIMPGQDFVAGTVIEGVTIKNVDPEMVKSTCTHMYYQGTYDKITLTESNQRFVSDNNYLYSPNSVNGSPMGAFRCYFTIRDDAPVSAMAKRAQIVFAPQTTTGLESIQPSEISIQKVLRDGQLFIIRDGKTYNAQGVLVKSE